MTERYDQIRYDGRQDRIEFEREVYAAAGITMVDVGKYLVPSSSGNGEYAVAYRNGGFRCDCPSRKSCKHSKLVRDISDYVSDEFGME